jgi:hypothetical protein
MMRKRLLIVLFCLAALPLAASERSDIDRFVNATLRMFMDPLEPERKRARECVCQRRLPDARDVFEQDVAARQQRRDGVEARDRRCRASPLRW